jgi:hypothetical protein
MLIVDNYLLIQYYKLYRYSKNLILSSDPNSTLTDCKAKDGFGKP